MNPVRFVIYRDRIGYHRWYLQAANGEKVAASEGYTSRAAAVISANRVKRLAYVALVTPR